VRVVPLVHSLSLNVWILQTSSRSHVEPLCGFGVILYDLISLARGTWLELELARWNAVHLGKSRREVCRRNCREDFENNGHDDGGERSWKVRDTWLGDCCCRCHGVSC